MSRSLAGTFLLLAVALVIRAWHMDLARFGGDEVLYWETSLAIARGEAFPLLGPEITGGPARLPGPMSYLLNTPPYLFSTDPRAGAWVVILGHVLAIWLFSRLARRAAGEEAGWIALIVGAFAAWDILYSDRMWGSNQAPVWGTIGLYAASRARGSAAWQALAVFVLGTIPHIHLSAILMWIAAFVVWIGIPPVEEDRGRWGLGLTRRGMIAGALLLTAGYLPFIIHEFQTGGQGLKNIFAYAAPGGGSGFRQGYRFLFNAVLFDSAEIGYHLKQGFWGGFDDASYYLSGRTLQDRYAQFGRPLTVTVIYTVALSAVAWLWTLARGAWIAGYPKKRSFRQGELALTGGLVAAFALGFLMLVRSGKYFFPHYGNILIPLALWPLVSFLVALYRSPRTRWAVPVVYAPVVVASLTHVRTFYRDHDGLNGIGPTLGMVNFALELDEPSSVKFLGFRNELAWTALARTYYGKPIPTDDFSELEIVVHNRTAAWDAAPPRFGPVKLRTQRRPVDPDVAGRLFSAFSEPQLLTVTSSAPGARQTCVPDERGICAYGPNSWQTLRPARFEMDGRPRFLLSAHPIAQGTVTVRSPVPAGTDRVRLTYGLSDAARRSGNRSPVQIVARQGANVLATDRATNARGLRRRMISVTSTRSLDVEIFTEVDGQRFFGLQVEAFAARTSTKSAPRP